ncbi:putative flippase GtrA [Paraburkholderia sp. GAS448]|uniref:GtrA family protein n=1 Tax=Paraburkholderia sp. GAS448 TaxID=3035136 RepID=UPI003D1FC0F4
MKYCFSRKLLAFGCVGAIGFAVDAGVLSLLTQEFGLDVYLSRLISFPTAVCATWLLNRTWVFKHPHRVVRNKRREYLSYFSIQSIGALLNFGIFSAALIIYPDLRAYPIIPLAFGAVAGLLFNYAGSHYWVFKHSS